MPPADQPQSYSVAARRFHWWTVAFLAVQVPLGLVMVYRGKTLNLWNDLTNWLYSTHKLIGILILIHGTMVARTISSRVRWECGILLGRSPFRT